MADEQHDDPTKPSREVSRGEESHPEPHPTPTAQDAAKEIEEEDRFEATDN